MLPTRMRSVFHARVAGSIEYVDRSLTTNQVDFLISSLIRRRSGLPMALFGNGVSRN
jgi:hypothetical protein